MRINIDGQFYDTDSLDFRSLILDRIGEEFLDYLKEKDDEINSLNELLDANMGWG